MRKVNWKRDRESFEARGAAEAAAYAPSQDLVLVPQDREDATVRARGGRRWAEKHSLPPGMSRRPAKNSGGRPAPDPSSTPTSSYPSRPKTTPHHDATAYSQARLVGAVLALLLWLVALVVASEWSKKVLHPLFGSVPTSHRHLQSTLVLDALSFLLRRSRPSQSTALMLAVMTAVLVWKAPSIVWLLAPWSGRLGPELGPVLFQFLLYRPLRFIGLSFVSGITVSPRTIFGPSPELMASQSQISPALGLEEKTIFVVFVVASASLQSQFSSFFAPYASVGLPWDLAPRLADTRDLQQPVVAGSILLASFLSALTVRSPASPGLPPLRPSSLPFLLPLLALLLIPSRTSPSSVHPYHVSRSSPSHRLLARRHSLTGLVSVGEVALSPLDPLDSVVRYLRADHSLLGGTWIGPKRRQVREELGFGEGEEGGEEVEKRAVEEAESVYATFVLQEAVRLVERPDHPVSSDRQDRALILYVPLSPRVLILGTEARLDSGLGTGIAARSLIKHNLSVDVVEIDPAVLDFAHRYFALPFSPGKEHVEDARGFLRRARRRLASDDEEEEEEEEGKWDYVVHDVFTGGAVPAALFTIECWQDVKSIMTASGVLAVVRPCPPFSPSLLFHKTLIPARALDGQNFAGDLKSEASRLVLASLDAVFPACRAFEEPTGAEEDSGDFKNMVRVVVLEWIRLGTDDATDVTKGHLLPGCGEETDVPTGDDRRLARVSAPVPHTVFLHHARSRPASIDHQ